MAICGRSSGWTPLRWESRCSALLAAKWHTRPVVHDPKHAMTRENRNPQTRMPIGIDPGRIRMAKRYPQTPFGQGLASAPCAGGPQSVSESGIFPLARVCDIRHTCRMGLSAAAAAAQAARLTPTIQPDKPASELGHRRGSTYVDRSRTDALELRGLPAVGRGAGPGAIRGSRPGDSVAALERDERHLRMRAARASFKPQR